MIENYWENVREQVLSLIHISSDACEEITFSCAALLHPKMPENIKDTKSKTVRKIPGIFFPLEVIIGFPLFLILHVYFFIIALPF